MSAPAASFQDPTFAPALQFCEAAALKVQQLIEEEGNPKLNLRVYIIGGGCSGLQYQFTFEEEIKPDDTVITKILSSGKAVNLLVNPVCLQYLENAEIDYEEGIAGERFVIRNPTAKTTCGCGSSFDV